MSATMQQLLLAHEHDTIIAQPSEPIITARDARRKAASYMAGEISLMMYCIEPALVFSNGRLVWRVLIEFTTPSRGSIGFIGVLDVDARTGDLNIPANFVENLEASARALLKESPYATEAFVPLDAS